MPAKKKRKNLPALLKKNGQKSAKRKIAKATVAYSRSKIIARVLYGAPVAVVYPTLVLKRVAMLPSILGGLFVWFAMGVDFPESKRRFSRLS